MKHTTTFSTRASLKQAWNTYKIHGWFISGMFIATLLVSFITGSIFDTETILGDIISNIVSIAVSILIAIGWTTIALRYAGNHLVTYKDFFSRYTVFWKFLAASVLYGLIVFGGLLLFIVPGIFWAIKYKMYSYLIVEKNMGIMESLKTSGTITYGVKWKLFGFAVVTFALNVLGILALGVGFVVTAPIVMLASAHVYKTITKTTAAEPVVGTPEVLPAESVSEAVA